jgi:hypothetical protein
MAISLSLDDPEDDELEETHPMKKNSTSREQ